MQLWVHLIHSYCSDCRGLAATNDNEKKNLMFESLRSESEKAHQEKCSLCVAVWILWEPNRQLILFAMMVLRQGESKPKNQIKGVTIFFPF